MSSKPNIDLREILEISANILSGIGGILNLFLLYLIVFKTPKRMSEYKVILFHNLFTDFLFNVVYDIVKGHVDMKNGSFYIIGTTVIFPRTNLLNIILIHLWLFSLFYCVTAIPAQFVYRYFLIVQNRKPSKFSLIFLFLMAFFSPLFIPLLWFYAECSDANLYETKLSLLTSDTYYFLGVPAFIVAEIHNWPLRYSCAVGFFLVFASCGITALSFWKVWKKLKSLEISFPTQTKKKHSQMTKTMIQQATVPLIFILIPIGTAITAVFLLLDIPGFGIIINFISGWIPVVNPLVTIISVKPYRKTVLSIFRFPRRKISAPDAVPHVFLN